MSFDDLVVHPCLIEEFVIYFLETSPKARATLSLDVFIDHKGRKGDQSEPAEVLQTLEDCICDLVFGNAREEENLW